MLPGWFFRILLEASSAAGGATSVVDRKLALDSDARIQLLDECGYLPTSPFAFADRTKIPDGLNPQETKSFLRTKRRSPD
jgi:hypothetical protein